MAAAAPTAPRRRAGARWRPAAARPGPGGYWRGARRQQAGHRRLLHLNWIASRSPGRWRRIGAWSGGEASGNPCEVRRGEWGWAGELSRGCGGGSSSFGPAAAADLDAAGRSTPASAPPPRLPPTGVPPSRRARPTPPPPRTLHVAAAAREMHLRREGMYFYTSSVLGGKLPRVFASVVGEGFCDAQCQLEMKNEFDYAVRLSLTTCYSTSIVAALRAVPSEKEDDCSKPATSTIPLMDATASQGMAVSLLSRAHSPSCSPAWHTWNAGDVEREECLIHTCDLTPPAPRAGRQGAGLERRREMGTPCETQHVSTRALGERPQTKTLLAKAEARAAQ